MLGDRGIMTEEKGIYTVHTKPGQVRNAKVHESSYCGLCGGGGSGDVSWSMFLSKLLS